jgi:hypothetical protein
MFKILKGRLERVLKIIKYEKVMSVSTIGHKKTVFATRYRDSKFCGIRHQFDFFSECLNLAN